MCHDHPARRMVVFFLVSCLQRRRHAASDFNADGFVDFFGTDDVTDAVAAGADRVTPWLCWR
jgi:hypothetical protein